MRYLRYALLGLLALAALLLGPIPLAEAATFTVDSTGDGGDSNTADGVCNDGSGNCTLRAAIEQANASVGTDTIVFNIPGAGPHTISPGAGGLPWITDPVIIDGTSEPDFVSSPIVELDGTNAGAGKDGLFITAGSSTVKGLVINRFADDGISLSANGGNTIEGNYIGTDATGTADLGNGDGVYIGIGASNNIIGGTVAGARNVISGNNRGVYIDRSTATGNKVQGNYIGTDVTGTADLGNSTYGVEISWASSNTIGGTAAGAGNIISGNNRDGVYIESSGAMGNVVQGNYIGTDVTGTADLGNSSRGVLIFNAPSNTIGGTAAGARNVISGNDLHGVWFSGSGAMGNVVQGNYIGTDVTGTADLGNGQQGVAINKSASNNTIGGTAAGAGNVISGNLGGVMIISSGATGNTIRGNSIHSNSWLGIDNINGGNTELTQPTVTAAGSASGTACPNCDVDVFSDDVDEGRIFHGSTIADGAGSWSFSGAVTGPNVTATATDASGNTSEFSVPFVLPTPTPTPTPTPIPSPIAVGGIVELVTADVPPAASKGSDGSNTLMVVLGLGAMLVLGAGASRCWRSGHMRGR